MAIPPGGRPGARRPGVRRRAAARVGLPAGHGYRPWLRIAAYTRPPHGPFRYRGW